MNTRMICEECGWPIAPDGVTLTGDAALPIEGAKPERCQDASCVADPNHYREYA